MFDAVDLVDRRLARHDRDEGIAVEEAPVEPQLGVVVSPDAAGQLVTQLSAHSAAARAGVRVGDVLLSIDGLSAAQPDVFDKWRADAARRVGKPFSMRVRRDGEALTLTGTVQVATLINARLEEDPTASPKAVAIRHGLLTGSVSRRR